MNKFYDVKWKRILNLQFSKSFLEINQYNWKFQFNFWRKEGSSITEMYLPEEVLYYIKKPTFFENMFFSNKNLYFYYISRVSNEFIKYFLLFKLIEIVIEIFKLVFIIF